MPDESKKQRIGRCVPEPARNPPSRFCYVRSGQKRDANQRIPAAGKCFGRLTVVSARGNVSDKRFGKLEASRFDRACVDSKRTVCFEKRCRLENALVEWRRHQERDPIPFILFGQCVQLCRRRTDLPRREEVDDGNVRSLTDCCRSGRRVGREPGNGGCRKRTPHPAILQRGRCGWHCPTRQTDQLSHCRSLPTHDLSRRAERFDASYDRAPFGNSCVLDTSCRVVS
jgi:hypothetical protein